MKAARYLLALVVSSLFACSGQLGPGGGVGQPEPPPVPVVPEMQTPPPVSTLRSPPPARAERPGVPPRQPVIAASPGLPPEPMPLPRSLSTDQQSLARLAADRATMEPRGNYRIGPGDLIEINVFDLAEMNRKERVSSGGFIQMPLIGAIQATGRTESELAADIAGKLSENYLQNPQVSVVVDEYMSKQVAVTGSVAKPGLYPLTRDRYTLLDMLSEAGGRTRDAGSIVEFVPASSSGASAAFAAATAGGRVPARAETRDAITIDLDQVMQNSSRSNLSFPLVGGDVIVVPEAGSFTIEGWIDKPGTYTINRHTTALGAISAAGGPLFPALLSEVEILRSRSDSSGVRAKQIADLNRVQDGEVPDVELRSGDVIHVPGSVPLMVPWGFWELLKTMVRFGASVSTIP